MIDKDPRQVDLEEWLGLRVDRNIVTITEPIDPSAFGEDEAVSITVEGSDPSKVVTDPSSDPRGPAFSGKPVDTGPTVLPYKPGDPLVVSRQPAVQTLRSNQDTELADFVMDLGINPADVGLTERPPSKPRQTPKSSKTPTPAKSGDLDMLERARINALRTLAAMPKGCELFVGSEEMGVEAVELAMGLGFLIAKGLAVYRGDGHYRLSEAGRAASLKEGQGR
jgi:hypothetical protein